MKLWFYLACASLSSVICLIATVGMSWGDLMTFANRMTQVGAALEIESPGTINLVRSTRAAIGSGKPELPMGVLLILMYCRWLHQDKRRFVGNAELRIM